MSGSFHVLFMCADVSSSRFLRPLTAVGYMAEKVDGLYGETKFTKQLQQRVTEGTVRYM